MMFKKLLVSFAVLLFVEASVCQAIVIRVGSGPDIASIQSVVDLYRSDLGALNPNVAGSFGTGRREINWDAVPDGFSAPNDLPGNFFNVNSPRGALFSTPGTSVQVSADSNNPTGTAVRFGNINPTYGSSFRAFSPERLFSPIGSNIVDMTFRVPGSNIPALSRGFGAVYTDIDLANNSSFEFFDFLGASLGQFSAPASDNGLSFLGVSFANPIVSRVRIAYGNSPLGPSETSGIDVAVMDDFFYGEPVAVPEPTSILVFACAALGLAFRRPRF